MSTHIHYCNLSVLYSGNDHLALHTDLEEQLEIEAIRQQETVSVREEEKAMFEQETSSSRKISEDFPSEQPDSMNLPPPDWPDSPLEENIPAAEWVQGATHTNTHTRQSVSVKWSASWGFSLCMITNKKAVTHVSQTGVTSDLKCQSQLKPLQLKLCVFYVKCSGANILFRWL